MPKEFKQFDKDETVNREYSNRDYATRMFVTREGMAGNVSDVEDLEIIDFNISASSYPEAMGKWLGKVVQMYCANLAVFMSNEFTGHFANAIDDIGHDKAKEMFMEVMNSEDEISSLTEEEKESKWEDFSKQYTETDDYKDVRIKVGYAIEILDSIMENVIHSDNNIFWQEPEMVVMGNPNIIEGMKINAETVEDIAKDTVEKMETFLKQTTKSEQAKIDDKLAEYLDNKRKLEEE